MIIRAQDSQTGGAMERGIKQKPIFGQKDRRWAFVFERESL